MRNPIVLALAVLLLIGVSQAGLCGEKTSGPAWGIAGEVAPEEAIRNLLRQAGWEEDLLHAADGPGTTSFALRKDGILCVVSGGAPSGIEDGKIFMAEKYELEARCVAESAREGTAPGHRNPEAVPGASSGDGRTSIRGCGPNTKAARCHSWRFPPRLGLSR